VENEESKGKIRNTKKSPSIWNCKLNEMEETE
jgi:hypothetical protein